MEFSQFSRMSDKFMGVRYQSNKDGLKYLNSFTLAHANDIERNGDSCRDPEGRYKTKKKYVDMFPDRQQYIEYNGQPLFNAKTGKKYRPPSPNMSLDELWTMRWANNTNISRRYNPFTRRNKQ
jgi:hypothetical protein